MSQPEPALSGSALMDFASDSAKPLIAAGLLVEEGHEPADASQDGQDLPVSLVWRDEDQGYGHFDPSVGWLTPDPARLARLRVDMGAVAKALLPRRALSGSRLVELIPDTLWDLGNIRLPLRTKAVSVLFARRVADAATWRAIKKALATRPRSTRILLSAATVEDGPGDLPAGVMLVSLVDVLVDDCDLAVDREVLSARLDGYVVASSDEPVVVVGDGRQVMLHGEVFRFTGQQQLRIIRTLHERYLAGERMTAWEEIAETLGLRLGARFRDYFKKCKPPVLGRLLKEEGGLVGFCLRG